MKDLGDWLWSYYIQNITEHIGKIEEIREREICLWRCWCKNPKMHSGEIDEWTH